MLSNKTLTRMRDLERDKGRIAQKQASLIVRLKKDLAKMGLTVSAVTRHVDETPRVVTDNEVKLARVVQNHNRRARRRKRAA